LPKQFVRWKGTLTWKTKATSPITLASMSNDYPMAMSSFLSCT
jgi:hypothetical protein